MLPKPGQLVSWLEYREITPPNAARLLIQGMGEDDAGDPSEPNWLHEGWDVTCCLVSRDHAGAAQDSITGPYFRFSPGWANDEEFDFAGVDELGEVLIEPFVFQYAHPIDQTTIVELRQDFILYHKLDRPCMEVYVHPAEGVEVAWVQDLGHPDRLANVSVNADFLRDFLAACGKAMVIRLVMDRFANTQDVSGLGLKAFPERVMAPGHRQQLDIYRPFEGGDFWRLRSTLWRNFIIEPYPKPKADRNPWYILLGGPVESGHRFYWDEQGKKGTLTEAGCPAYLHFRRDVLRRYLTTRGFQVAFHMRDWGFAVNPKGQGVDVGINEAGQATAFAPDIAKLPMAQQAHWAAYSCFPSGGVCRALFQTRMQCAPPHSPSVVELAREATAALNRSIEGLAGQPLYAGDEPPPQELCALTVGTLSDEVAEIARLAKVLYQMTVESMDVKLLRSILKNADQDEAKQWGTIRCLQELLSERRHGEASESRSLLEPLRHLNWLRQADAHLAEVSIEEVCEKYGLVAPPRTFCNVWDAVVDKTVACLHRVASVIVSNAEAEREQV